jgi:hypothetical protein
LPMYLDMNYLLRQTAGGIPSNVWFEGITFRESCLSHVGRRANSTRICTPV